MELLCDCECRMTNRKKWENMSTTVPVPVTMKNKNSVKRSQYSQRRAPTHTCEVCRATTERKIICRNVSCPISILFSVRFFIFFRLLMEANDGTGNDGKRRRRTMCEWVCFETCAMRQTETTTKIMLKSKWIRNEKKKETLRTKGVAHAWRTVVDGTDGFWDSTFCSWQKLSSSQLTKWLANLHVACRLFIFTSYACVSVSVSFVMPDPIWNNSHSNDCVCLWVCVCRAHT